MTNCLRTFLNIRRSGLNGKFKQKLYSMCDGMINISRSRPFLSFPFRSEKEIKNSVQILVIVKRSRYLIENELTVLPRLS